MNIVKVISTSIENLKSRILIKFLRLGNSDIQERYQLAPSGFDSNPIKDMIAVYSETSEKGKAVIIGYINPDQITQPGESRMYATDSNGVLKLHVHLKDDGTAEIGGTGDFLVRYNELNTALQTEKIAINTELVKIQTAIASLGGAYAHIPVTVDISGAKITELETL